MTETTDKKLHHGLCNPLELNHAVCAASTSRDKLAKMASAVSDADYVCTLNEKSAKKAKDELKEDPKNRLGAVEKFRELVLQQPHIKCPTGVWYSAYTWCIG